MYDDVDPYNDSSEMSPKLKLNIINVWRDKQSSNIVKYVEVLYFDSLSIN